MYLPKHFSQTDENDAFDLMDRYSFATLIIRDAPTWNYAVAHVTRKAKLIEDFDGVLEILQRLTTKLEASRANPWELELPDDLRSPIVLVKAIVGFEIEIIEQKTKFKMNQNRSQTDQKSVINGLESCDL